MADFRNNIALRSYINFNDYRQTIEALDNYGKEPEPKTKQKGLMTLSRAMTKQKPLAQDDGQDKELRKVLEYVKMIEGLRSGS